MAGGQAGKLTGKQEGFAQDVVRGLNASDAYRNHYSTKAASSRIHSDASKLLANPKVAQRVAELREKATDVTVWSFQDSVRSLKEVIDETDKGSEIVSAVRVLNEMHGFNAPQQHDVQVGLKPLPDEAFI